MPLYEYFCQHCGEAFDDDFSPLLDYYICKHCGEITFNPKIYSGEKYPGVYWFCDKCNVLLNTQYGFRDNCKKWKCKSCGYKNYIDEKHM